MSDNKAPCPVGTRVLPAYLAGKLTGTPTEEEFKEHVRTCEDCKALVTDRRKAMQVLIASAETALTEGTPAKPTKPNTSYSLAVPGLKNFPWKLLAGVSGGAIFLITLTYVFGPQISTLGQSTEEKQSSTNSSSQPSSPAEKTLKTETTASTSAVHLAEEEETPKDLKPPLPPQTHSQGTKPLNAKSPTAKPNPRPTVRPKPSRRFPQAPSTKPTQPLSGAPKASPNSPKPQARVEITDETGKRIGETIIPNMKEANQ